MQNEIILFDTWLKSCAWGKHFSLFCHHQDTESDDTHHTYKKVKKCSAERQNLVCLITLRDATLSLITLRVLW
jgi:hypothetical protein